jgi:hypothetical protein
MSMRQIALTGTLLAIVFLAHAAGRFTQVGGAQFAASIGVYTLMALLLAPQLGWGALAGVGLATGILTMLATSSPFPPANIPAHGIGFLTAAALAKATYRGDREYGLGTMLGILAATLLVSWTLFAIPTWLGLTNSAFGLANTRFLERQFEVFGMTFGQGIVAWWLFGFVSVGIPTYVISAILLPLLYRAVQPALVRQGMLPATHGAASGR